MARNRIDKKNLFQDLKSLPLQDLNVKIDEWRRDLFGLRLNAATAHIKDFSQFKKLRKNIARGLTLAMQKKSEQDSSKVK